MQELIFHIAYMERRKYQDEQTQILGGMNDCIMYDAIVIQNRVIEELTKEYSVYLKKEKEQMYNAWKKSAIESSEYDIIDEIEYDIFEQYYNKTYNQNES